MVHLDWVHRVQDIGEEGLSEKRVANREELSSLARALEILSCDALAVAYELRPSGGSKFRLQGRLEADVTQACIMTLEPVEARIEEQLDIEFRPSEMMPRPVPLEAEVSALEDFEPVENGTVDIGRVVYEYLSAALDPYPRKKGAAFDWKRQGADEGTQSPFAVLANLKKPG